MNGKSFCKRCFLLESGKEDILKDIEEHKAKIPPSERAPKEEYEKRLGICRECEKLIDGCCMRCGCYPEFRAAFIGQKCPSGKWN